MTKTKYLLPYTSLFCLTIHLCLKADLLKGNLSGIDQESYVLVAFLCVSTAFLNAIIIKHYYGFKKALLFFLALSSAVFFPYEASNPGSLFSSLHVILGYVAFGVYALTILYHLQLFRYKHLLQIYVLMLGVIGVLYIYFLCIVGLMEMIFLSSNLVYFFIFSYKMTK